MRHPRARQALITTSAASKRVMILHGEGSAVRIHVKGHATKRMYGLGHVVDLNADNHIRVGLRGKPYLSRRWPGQRRAGRLPKCCASSGTVNCLYPARARHEARVSRSSRPHSLSLGRQLGEAVEWRARGAAPQAAPRAAKERQFGRRATRGRPWRGATPDSTPRAASVGRVAPRGLLVVRATRAEVRCAGQDAGHCCFCCDAVLLRFMPRMLNPMATNSVCAMATRSGTLGCGKGVAIGHAARRMASGREQGWRGDISAQKSARGAPRARRSLPHSPHLSMMTRALAHCCGMASSEAVTGGGNPSRIRRRKHFGRAVAARFGRRAWYQF